MLIEHPDGKLCNIDGMTHECEQAQCVYYQYGYHSKCSNRHEQLSSNIKKSLNYMGTTKTILGTTINEEINAFEETMNSIDETLKSYEHSF